MLTMIGYTRILSVAVLLVNHGCTAPTNKEGDEIGMYNNSGSYKYIPSCTASTGQTKLGQLDVMSTDLSNLA